MDKPINLEPFRNLSHTGFDIGGFRPVFVKAAWKTYNEHTAEPISAQRFQAITTDLFDALFFSKPKEIPPILDEIRDLFSNTSQIEFFLTDTFYILLNHYIKSFYGKLNGWEKIIRFTTGIEQFIAFAAGHISDESLFLFEDTLIDALERLRQSHEPIMVLNTYYGVPIQYPAKVVHTDIHSVTIKPHPIQETAALLQNGIYLLKSNQLSGDVYASVNPVYIDGERLLELSRFDQLETSLYHRQSVRVQPNTSHTINIIHSGLTLHCRLYDISIGGIALTSKHLYSIPAHSETTLIFPSDIITNLGEITGYLVFKSSYEGGYKYHFKIEPSLQQEGELSKYIARREQEIVKQLREEII
ncbi:MAG: PilZ domain-containing protein [Sulfuricurvum sp.]|nr:PilZ domain-containing protein [Sulfuricurvum sp.]